MMRGVLNLYTNYLTVLIFNYILFKFFIFNKLLKNIILYHMIFCLLNITNNSCESSLENVKMNCLLFNDN